MATVNTLEVKITGDDSNLQRTLGGAQVAIVKWGAAAASAAAAAAAAFVRSGLRSADALEKQARQLNATSEELAKVRRAADLAGVSNTQLESSMRQLNRRLGEAIGGTGAAGEALNRLGLSAADLANLPLPERIAVINQALSDHVPAAQRAAVAAQLFGERGAQAMALIDPQTISTAADQVDRLGGALSAVQAAQIEAANDAMSTMSLLTTGVSQRLAAQFAPALEGIANQLFEAAAESQGFQDAVEKAYELTIGGVSHVLNAFDAITRAVRIVANAIDVAFSFAAEQVAKYWGGILRTVDRLPGVDFSDAIASLDEFAVAANQRMTSAIDGIGDLFDKDFAGDRFKAFVEEMEERSREAAERIVAERDRVAAEAFGVGGPAEESEELIQFREQLAERIEAIRQAAMTEREIQQELMQDRIEQLQEFLDTEQITEEEHRHLREELAREHANRMAGIAQKEADDRAAIERQVQQQILSMRQAALSSAVGLLQTLGSESKTAAIAAIALNKGLMIAQTIQNTAAAQMRAYAELGPIAGPPAAARIGVLGRIQAGIIAATGLVQAAGVGSGGASAGSPGAAPIATTGGAGTTSGGGTTGGGMQQVATINIAGENFSRGQVVSLIESINELAEDGVRLVVN